MPGAPVHSISFSALSAAPMPAATVSALMLSSVPVVVRGHRAHDRHQAVVEQLLQHFRIDQIDVADEAVVDQSDLRPVTGGRL